jgi:alkylation response protein AidB-like acyl-CoA dehydrogenase
VNFDLSEDETMFKALAERFVADHYDGESRRAYQAESAGFSHEKWLLLGELGLIAAPFDEAAGGLGLDATAIATVFEALGRGLTVEPLIENVLLAGRLFADHAPEALRDAWIPSLLTGERRIALAHAEARGRGGHTWVETRASASDGTVRLSGSKSCVPAGNGANGFIVSARTAGTPGDASGTGLYFVPAGAPGLDIVSWRMADGGAAVSLTFDAVAAEPLAGGVAEIDAAQVLANLARCAEALGIMERMFAETAEYLRTREQFGARLASFQALQHRMAAQYAVIEQSRALVNLALVSDGTAGFPQAVQGARAYIAAHSIELGHEMIQFHGGMGVSDELSIGHGHKRLLVLSRWPDDPEVALDRFAGIAA